MEVTIYSTHTCPFCKQEKEYLNQQGIEYTNYFVDDDPDKAQEMMDKSNQRGVPFTIIVDDNNQEHRILGFRRDKLDQILGL